MSAVPTAGLAFVPVTLPGDDAEPVRVWRNVDAAPFARRTATRVALNARRGLPSPTAPLRVTDTAGLQSCWIFPEAGELRVSDGAPAGEDEGVAPLVVDWLADEVTVPDGAEIPPILAPIETADWEQSAKLAWDRWQGLPGMPSELYVTSTSSGREVTLGQPGQRFRVFGDDHVLDRLFRGDVLFDEVLFSHRIRIVGGLAQVSVLIGASMREAFGDFAD